MWCLPVTLDWVFWSGVESLHICKNWDFSPENLWQSVKCKATTPQASSGLVAANMVLSDPLQTSGFAMWYHNSASRAQRAIYLLTRSWERLLISSSPQTFAAKTVALRQRRRWHEDPVRLSFKGTGVECDCQLLLPLKCNIVTPDYDDY